MNSGLHLIIQYCSDPRPARADEYNECLRRNLANPAIASVHNLIENQTAVPEEFRSHPKYSEHRLGRWLTYKDALDYANANLAGETVCILNLDIFLASDSNWTQAQREAAAGVVFCLSRIEWDRDGSTFLDPVLEATAYAASQDAWIFTAPFVVEDCDFEIGTPGCDNAFAYRVKQSGRIPINACMHYSIFHFDRARGKSAQTAPEIHAAERSRVKNRRPEQDGQYLVPVYGRPISIDQLLNVFKATDLERYMLLCDVMTKWRRVVNK